MTKPINDLTAEQVRALLDYDPETGILRWRVDRGRRRCAGQIAGTIGKEGYVRIGIDGRLYMAHRLAWLIMTGEWPGEWLDHRKGNRADNRWRKLREATREENSANTAMRVDNTSGARGVTFHPATEKWMARVGAKGVRLYLGLFDTKEEAALAAERGRREHHGQFAR